MPQADTAAAGEGPGDLGSIGAVRQVKCIDGGVICRGDSGGDRVHTPHEVLVAAGYDTMRFVLDADHARS